MMDQAAYEAAAWRAIARAIPETYGWVPGVPSPVTGGYLNLKWRVEGGSGYWLVKHFHPKRFSPERLARIEAQLKWQSVLLEQGLPTPALLAPKGRLMHTSAEGHVYMIMTLMPGRPLLPGTANVAQMHALGQCTGQMHALTDALPRRVEPEEVLTQAIIMTRLEALREKAEGDAACLNLLERYEGIARRLPVLPFEDADVGWVHADYAIDNILLDGDTVTAIVDFDRNRFGYRGCDIGRIVVSAALNENGLSQDKLDAFLEGYNEERVLTRSALIQALRLTWAQESGWWIRPDIVSGESGGKPRRFSWEIQWLGAHWDDLDDL